MGFHGSVEWEAMMDWIEFHGLDPNRILCDAVIERRPETCSITEYVKRDEDGKIVHIGFVVITEEITQQGERPPLPFPAELFEVL